MVLDSSWINIIYAEHVGFWNFSYIDNETFCFEIMKKLTESRF